MTSVLSLALALVCAYSQPDCGVTQRIVPAVAPLPAAAPTWAGSVTEWRNGAAVGIVIRPDIDQPAAIAALIVHESTNIRSGPHRECGQWERDGYAEQVRFFAWMDRTFGPPVLTGVNVWARLGAALRVAGPLTPC